MFGLDAMSITTRPNFAMVIRLYFAAFGDKSKLQRP